MTLSGAELQFNIFGDSYFIFTAVALFDWPFCSFEELLCQQVKQHVNPACFFLFPIFSHSVSRLKPTVQKRNRESQVFKTESLLRSRFFLLFFLLFFSAIPVLRFIFLLFALLHSGLVVVELLPGLVISRLLIPGC